MRRELSIFVALIALCLLVGWSNPAFYGMQNIANTLRQIGMYGILAVGIAYVMIQGGIDLSIGSVVGLTGVIIAKISSASEPGLGHDLWKGILVALLAAVLIGLMHGLLVTKLKLQPFIVTLGGMLLVRGIAQVITENGNISLGLAKASRATDVISPAASLKILGSDGLLYYASTATGSVFSFFKPATAGAVPLVPWPMLIFIIVLMIAGFVLHFTVFGRHLFAIGGNRDAAVYSGLPVARNEIITYVLSSVFAALAGICFAGYTAQMSHANGTAYELSAIAAAVLGGISLRGGEGTMISVLVGTALMRVIENAINLFQWAYVDDKGVRRVWTLGSEYLFVVIGSVILLAVIIDQVIHEIGQRRKRAG